MISLSAAHGQQAQRQCFTWNISQTTSVTAPRFLIARRPVLVHTAIPDAIDMIPDFVPEVEKRGTTEDKYDNQSPEIEISHSRGPFVMSFYLSILNAIARDRMLCAVLGGVVIGGLLAGFVWPGG